MKTIHGPLLVGSGDTARSAEGKADGGSPCSAGPGRRRGWQTGVHRCSYLEHRMILISDRPTDSHWRWMNSRFLSSGVLCGAGWSSVIQSATRRGQIVNVHHLSVSPVICVSTQRPYPGSIYFQLRILPRLIHLTVVVFEVELIVTRQASSRIKVQNRRVCASFMRVYCMGLCVCMCAVAEVLGRI